MLKRKVVMVLWGVLLLAATCFAQGPMIPPGPPGEIYKSLGEIEPRIPIKSLPFSIDAPGSYYLTESLNYATPSEPGVSINASNATIDLMGFSLTGPGMDSSYVYPAIQNLVPNNNITIKNGVISDWTGSAVDLQLTTNTLVMNMNIGKIGGHGVYCENLAQVVNCNVNYCGQSGVNVGANSLVKDCNVTKCNNGVYVGANGRVINCGATETRTAGISVGAGSLVERCSSYLNERYGFLARGDSVSMIGCSSFRNDSHGFISSEPLKGDKYPLELLDCVSEDNGGDGVNAGPGSNIQRCKVNKNENNGINLAVSKVGIISTIYSSYSLVKDCHLYKNGARGIYVFHYAHVVGNHCSLNDSGIFVRTQTGIGTIPGRGARIEGNTVTNQYSYGIYVPADSNSLIIRNWAYSNVDDYFIGSGNLAGPIVSSDLSTNDNPHANFRYLLP